MTGKEEFEHLFQPVKIGPVEIKNRLAMAPTNIGMGGMNGEVTNQMVAYYGARAKGGFGVIIAACFLGTRMAAKYQANLNPHLYDPNHLPGIIELTDTIHYFGGKVFCQLSPGFGRQGVSWEGLRPYSASPTPIEMDVDQKAKLVSPPAFSVTPLIKGWLKKFCMIPREMTVEEIKREQREYVRSAWLAICGGFDGVEIHACHGYLLHQFLSPLVNKRKDEYGGPLENRMRFLIELAEMTKKMAGDFPIGVRISAEEHIPGGITIEDTKVVVKRLKEMGLDFLDLSDGAGWADSKPPYSMDGKTTRELLEHAAEFKKILSVPVITPGYIDPVSAEQAVREGKTDIISLGRQSFADPETPNKIREGRIKEIAKCIKCNNEIKCYPLRAGPNGFCSVNPNIGQEMYMPEYQRGPNSKGPTFSYFLRKLPPEPIPPDFSPQEWAARFKKHEPKKNAGVGI
jgi:2,4-dienoyl-CoA reductase-like NADH-dependent reductase (Old Yellow Enzyme family)